MGAWGRRLRAGTAQVSGTGARLLTLREGHGHRENGLAADALCLVSTSRRRRGASWPPGGQQGHAPGERARPRAERALQAGCCDPSGSPPGGATPPPPRGPLLARLLSDGAGDITPRSTPTFGPFSPRVAAVAGKPGAARTWGPEAGTMWGAPPRKRDKVTHAHGRRGVHSFVAHPRLPTAPGRSGLRWASPPPTPPPCDPPGLPLPWQLPPHQRCARQAWRPPSLAVTRGPPGAEHPSKTTPPPWRFPLLPPERPQNQGGGCHTDAPFPVVSLPAPGRHACISLSPCPQHLGHTWHAGGAPSEGRNSGYPEG